MHVKIKEINSELAKTGGLARVAFLQATVTQASLAIPTVPLYVSVYSKIMKEKGQFEDNLDHVYRMLTQAFAGMQEIMAVERLFDLLEDKRFDLVVLDTPPTTNVLQFFESPERMARFFDRRIVRWFLPNTESGTLRRLFSAQSAVMMLVGKVAGEDFAHDLQEFFGAMGNISEALSARSASLHSLLRLPSTRYVVVTGPQQSRIDETITIVDQLRSREYRPSAIIVNRVTPEHLISEADVRGHASEGSVLRGLKDKLDVQRQGLFVRAKMERGQIERLRERLGATLITVVPRLDVCLDSADGLHVLARALA